MSHEENKTATRARQAATSERYLAFQIGREQYGIPLLRVREVIEMSEPTPIPKSPPHFKGVIDLRGQIISVLDLRLKLSHQETKNGPKTAIVILDLEPHLFIGVVVDRVNSVLAFHSDELSPAPNSGSAGEKSVTAIARREGKLTLILDVRAALDMNEIDAIKNAAAAAA